MAKTNKTPKAEDNAELRTISLLKILNTYSDENHELSTKNIMDKLQKECGVTVHRTTVGKNIKQLADCGFDIYTHKTADGPTSIFVANVLNSQYIGAITVAAYSYMALVPIVQPPVIRLLTTKTERRIRMAYTPGSVSKTTKILFPVLITAVVGIVSNRSAALIGFLMFGNLLRECGVLNSLSDAAQNVLSNLITLILGITITAHMTAAEFLRVDTLLILGLGLIAFVFDTVGGVLFAKIMNLFVKNKVNPMIGAAGISAFPMSARIIQKMGQQEDPQNFLLMHAVGANVSGQIASVIAGGIILNMIH